MSKYKLKFTCPYCKNLINREVLDEEYIKFGFAATGYCEECLHKATALLTKIDELKENINAKISFLESIKITIPPIDEESTKITTSIECYSYVLSFLDEK